MGWSEKWTPRFLEILPAGIVVVVGVIAAIAVSCYMLCSRAETQENEAFEASAETSTARVSDWMTGRLNEIRLLAADDSIKALLTAEEAAPEATAALAESLKVIAKTTKAYKAAVVLDMEGAVLAASGDKAAEGADFASLPGFQEALQGKPVVSKVFKDGRKSAFFIFQPVYLERSSRGKAKQTADNVAGVLAMTVDMNKVASQFVKPLRVGDTGAAFIMDSQGLVIAHTDRKMVLEADLSGQGHGRRLMEENPGLLEYEADGAAMTAAVNPVAGTGWRMVLELPSEEHFAKASGIRAVLMVGGLVLAIFLFFAVWYFINKRAAIEAMGAIHRSLVLVEKVVLIILLFTMIFMQFGQVVARNIFQTGVMWIDEVLRIEVLWLAFLGAGLAAEYNRHIKIDVLSHIMGGGRASRVLDTSAQVFAMFASVFLFIAAYVYIMSEARYPAYTVVDTDFIRIPDHVFRMVIPYFFFIMSLRCVINIRRIFLGTHTRSIEP